jgi:hypothetical protein
MFIGSGNPLAAAVDSREFRSGPPCDAVVVSGLPPEAK